jgi:hypothetical protein
MFCTGLDVHGCRRWGGIPCSRHFYDRQHMRSGRQPGAIAATLYEGGDRPAIDLKIEAEIPSEVRRSIYDEATWWNVTRPEVTSPRLCNSADESSAAKSQYQKNILREAVF